MKIILLKDTKVLGKRGDVKEVADGYAINVLIKKELAVQATPGELARWKAKEDSVKHKKDLATNTFAQLINKLRNDQIIIAGKKHDEKGQLFAQIKEVDIVDAIFKATNFSIDTKQVIIPTAIKSTGKHSVEIKQGTQKEKITIEVR